MEDFSVMRKQRIYSEAEQEQRAAEQNYVAERKLEFYSDPDKAKIRRRAKKVIAQRIGEVLLPHGFEPGDYGTSWVVESWGVKRTVGVQASRGGDRCYINVGRVPNGLATLLGQKRSVVRLSRFCSTCVVDELGQLYYFDIEERPEILDKAVEVTSNYVVPWLLK